MAWIDRVVSAVTERSWTVIVVMLIATAALAPGLAGIEESSSVGDVSEESTVEAAHDEIQRAFSPNDPNTTTMVIAVTDEEENVLSREALIRSLQYQQSLRNNETLDATLVDERATFGVENVVARAAIETERRHRVPCCTISDWSGSSQPDREGASEDADEERAPPSLDEQIEQLESMNDSEVAPIVEAVLDPERISEGSRAASRMLPRTYDPGSTTADTRLIVVTQETEGEVRAAAGFSANVSEGQAAARSLAHDRDDDEAYHVFSRGLVPYQQDMAIQDSLAILGPLALGFVFVALSLVYRDPIDVVLGLIGVVVVLIWTMGAMGWLGLEFGPAMIAVPILLIALSVDYALHVVLRYREERIHGDGGVRDAMGRSLVGVGPALVLVTMTTAVGFFANYTSPFDDLQAFGLATAIGIIATLFVFLLLVPALKTVSGSFLERRGWDRTPSVPGSSGRFRGLLGGGAAIARRAPAAMLVAVLLLSSGAAYGATQVDVSAEQELFMADDPPEWTENLPDAVEPGEFFLKENRQFIFSKFQSPDKQGYILVEGNVTDPGTLERVAAADSIASESDVVFESGGEPEIETPLSAMRLVAGQNETFNATFHAADTDGDGVPDRTLETVYDEFYGAAPSLAQGNLRRTDDGEYTALRVRIATDGNADRADAVAVVTDAAAAFDGADELRATATGQPVVEKELNDDLATSMIESTVLTLSVILVLLMVVFRVKEGSASLGAVTLVPVVFSVTWLFGTMAVLDIPISIITALVGSISVGLGVDYAIHISERYWEEYGGDTDTETALARTVTGTGSAVMSSAITTAAGFGVLAFALLPGLRQFGFILAVGIVYSFLATVYIQPSVLALWAQYGPATAAPTESPVLTTDD